MVGQRCPHAASAAWAAPACHGGGEEFAVDGDGARGRLVGEYNSTGMSAAPAVEPGISIRRQPAWVAVTCVASIRPERARAILGKNARRAGFLGVV